MAHMRDADQPLALMEEARPFFPPKSMLTNDKVVGGMQDTN